MTVTESEFFSTALGTLYQGDCLEVLPHLQESSVHTIFADPPFNIGKKYGSRTDDSKLEEEYLCWCKRWIDE